MISSKKFSSILSAIAVASLLIPSSPVLAVAPVDTTPAAIAITAPTLTRASAITDTTIAVTDNKAIDPTGISVDASSTATATISCSSNGVKKVNCTANVTASGTLVIKAIDVAGNAGTASQAGYVIGVVTPPADTTAPVITITAPTLSDTATITDTTISVTDDTAVSSTQVTLDASTTAAATISCAQADAKTVNCSARVTGSGDLAIHAIDAAGNASTVTKSGYVITPPSHITISEDAAIPALTNDNTPSYAFETSKKADITYVNCTGDVSSSQANQTTVTTLSALADGTHTDCQITATTSTGQTSTATLTIPTFTVDTQAPTIEITAPTTSGDSTISDTTVTVTDLNGVDAADVSISGSSSPSFACANVGSNEVDCAGSIAQSGDLHVSATDAAGNTGSATQAGYVIAELPPPPTDTTAPVISLTAPTKHVSASVGVIDDTTVSVTDETSLNASGVTIDPSSTATASLSCVQTDTKTVDCTTSITVSGDLTIRAEDDAGNVSTFTETGYAISGTDPGNGNNGGNGGGNPNGPLTITEVTPVPALTNDSTPSYTFVTNKSADITYDHCTADLIASTKDVNATITFDTFTDGTYDTCVINATVGSTTVSLAVPAFTVDLTAPAIAVVSPTLSSATTISDTTVSVTDANGIDAANVAIGGTASPTFLCANDGDNQVDCSGTIAQSGDLSVSATDAAGNLRSSTVTGYDIHAAPEPDPDTTSPVISITAPTKSQTFTIGVITNTTVTVTDDTALLAADVTIDPSSTASATISCVQTDAKTVDCTTSITSAGNLVIHAIDAAGNASSSTEAGYTFETGTGVEDIGGDPIPDTTGPTIAISAPTHVSHAAITDTTITVTDEGGISAGDVEIGGTANPSFVCVNEERAVVCTGTVTRSGQVDISASDRSENVSARSESGYRITRNHGSNVPSGGGGTDIVTTADTGSSDADASGDGSSCESVPSGAFTIDQGATTTGSREVAISLTNPLTAGHEVMISELHNFGGAAFQPVQDSMSYTLSPEAGMKTIFVAVKGACADLEPAAASIDYVPADGGEVLGVKVYPDHTLIRGYGVKIFEILGHMKKYVINLDELRIHYLGLPHFNVDDPTLDQYETLLP